MSELSGNFLILSLLSFSLGALATATTVPGYISTFHHYFDKRLGAALGCAMIGIGIGAAFAPVLAQTLIATYGWRQSYVILAGIALCLGFIANLLCFAWGPKAVIQHASTRAAETKTATEQEGDSLRTALRSPRFWVIAIALFLVSASALGATIHLFSLLTDRHIDPVAAAGAAGTVGIAVAVGRFATGILLDWFAARLVASVVFVLGGTGLGLLAFSTGETSIVMYSLMASFFGLALGAEGDIIPFLTRRYFGRKAFGAIFGCFFSAYMLGAFAGPIVYGIGFDRLGGYTFPLIAGCVACLISAVLVFSIGPYRYAKGHQ